MICAQCGGELSAAARFCGDCGAAVLLPPPDPGGSSAAERTGETGTLTFSGLVATRWHLVLPSALTVPVEGPLLIGRRPDAARGPRGARLLTVEDPERTVSRTHLTLSPAAGGGVVATDLSGRNGIVVTGPGGQERRVTNASIELTAPCRIGLGRVHAWLRTA